MGTAYQSRSLFVKRNHGISSIFLHCFCHSWAQRNAPLHSRRPYLSKNPPHGRRPLTEQNLTIGSVGKNVLRFSPPYLLSYFLQTLYGMADLYIIGQFEGVTGTTAVSIGSQIMHMLAVDCGSY